MRSSFLSFPRRRSSVVTYIEGGTLDTGDGSAIGDLTSLGGLAVLFNGATNVTGGNCGGKDNTTSSYGGLSFTTSKRIFKVTTHGGNNTGYVNAVNPTMTLTLYGKTGSAPSSATDGTVLATSSFTDTANESAGRTMTSTDNVTQWDHAWVHFESTAGTDDHRIAEIVLYEAVPA